LLKKSTIIQKVDDVVLGEQLDKLYRYCADAVTEVKAKLHAFAWKLLLRSSRPG
jgi:hypothetical protein